MSDAAIPSVPNSRTRLRDFQVRLIERMQHARDDTRPAAHRLGVMGGGRRWLCNLQQVEEIIASGPITPVPLTRDWFLGLMNVRGNLVSVIDFARFLGMAAAPADKASRILVLAPGLAACSGVLVSGVLGLRNCEEMQEDDAPRDDQEVEWCGKSYLDRDAQRWTELDLSRLAQDARFIDVAR